MVLKLETFKVERQKSWRQQEIPAIPYRLSQTLKFWELAWKCVKLNFRRVGFGGVGGGGGRIGLENIELGLKPAGVGFKNIELGYERFYIALLCSAKWSANYIQA